MRALTSLSVRNTFGVGRGPVPKVIAIALLTFALVPALIQIALGAILGSSDFEFVRPEEYYSFIQAILVLFVAAMASELVGNDRKNNTLPLYFSRPIERNDYVFAKVIALTLALLSMTLVPQLLTFIGNWLGATDGTEWFTDNVTDLPAIGASALLLSAEFASIAILIATFSTKRAFALVSILGALLLSGIATSIMADLLPRWPATAIMLLCPLYVARALTLVLFDAVPDAGSLAEEASAADHIGFADIPGMVWILASFVHIGLAVWLSTRRYRRSI